MPTVDLDIHHWSYDAKTKKKVERTFTCDVLKLAEGRTFKISRRQFFIQLIKFAPGRTPKDYTEFYNEIDEKLRKSGKKTRHDLDIHEIATFVTFGRYDMVVLCDAPNMLTYSKFVASYVNSSYPSSFGTTETQIVAFHYDH